jgi:hypothetical protein
MFIEHKAPGEVTEITKLSQAIRVGALTIREDTTWSGCALATAGKAIGWKEEYGVQNLFDRLEQRFDLSRVDFMMVSQQHCCGISRLKIADQLEMHGL